MCARFLLFNEARSEGLDVAGRARERHAHHFWPSDPRCGYCLSEPCGSGPRHTQLPPRLRNDNMRHECGQCCRNAQLLLGQGVGRREGLARSARTRTWSIRRRERSSRRMTRCRERSIHLYAATSKVCYHARRLLPRQFINTKPAQRRPLRSE